MWGESGYEIKIGGFAATTFCTRHRQLVVRGALIGGLWCGLREWGESDLIKIGVCRHFLHRHAHIKTRGHTHTAPLCGLCSSPRASSHLGALNKLGK